IEQGCRQVSQQRGCHRKLSKGCYTVVFSSNKTFFIHGTLVKVAARAQYSAWVELRLTVVCLEHFQEKRLESKKTQYPVVE
ncbi:hypothetical protein PIB30_077854, partial [Stylosanthes scabra]|nr:hypothetical protein [Stylosanthes scabra]